MKLHAPLLNWYSKQKRDLPWRKNRDPYRIRLSEIMLQQTRVEAVLPYYERFLSNFPTVADLAAAETDTVTNLWAGLGYYSRARNLHAAARQVVADHGGKFPRELDELLSLKGVGGYTAAAVASIAFGKPHCALDGNLERVFSRLIACRLDPKSKAGRARLLELGDSLVQAGQPGEVNQAVMDLSSAICLPKNPRCGECPLAFACEARKLGVQAQLPVKRPKPEKILLTANAWAVVAGEELLLARRSPGSWLSGMWDLPWRIEKERATRAPAPFGEELAECSVNRTITKHKITFDVKGLLCRTRPGARELSKLCAEADEFRWVPLSDLHGINLPRASEKALEKILPKLN
ncbi:MAG: A/G-specific adenine glycosylase [Bdellovibrionota bacterium]